MIPVTRPLLGEDEALAVAEVLRSGWVTQGPRVAAFEQAFAARVGATHAVAVSSCTAALQLAFVALGIGPGDEVVCPSLSFIATANAISHAGARPVFAEVDEASCNLSPEAVAQALTPQTRAILAVHQIGLPADLAGLAALARERGLWLVEDAACAVGSRIGGAAIGRPHGIIACFSFHPRKLITTGEGGMLTTGDATLAERVRQLRQHGMNLSDHERHQGDARYRRESYPLRGHNFRMTDIQAAVGLVQLGRLDGILTRRRALAARYGELLTGLAPGLRIPRVPDGVEPNWQSYMIRFEGFGRERRDELIDRLAQAGVGSRPGIMTAHREACYADRHVELPISERLSDETLILPLYPDLSEGEQDRVVAALAEALTAVRPT